MIIHGANNMTNNYSKLIINKADEIVFQYAKYDLLSGCYMLNRNDISTLDLYSLAAMIMKEDSILASEVMGPDNSNYELYILPALYRYLANPSSTLDQEDYLIACREGVLSYLNPRIMELISDRLEEFNYSVMDLNNSKEDEEEIYTWAA
jgi:hypothetical protein